MSRWTCLLAGLALLFSACGGSDPKHAKTPPAPKQTATPPPVPKDKPAAKEDVAVIRGWTDALRRGDIGGASGYWTVPAIVSNGTPPITLKQRKDVRFFNRTLPCGAKVLRVEDTGAYLVARFRLTERPGPGVCGTGVGGEASTAFLIRRRHIVQWRRVVEPAPEATPAGRQS